MGVEPTTEQEVADTQTTPQTSELVPVIPNRHPLKRVGALVAGVLGVAMALGGAKTVAGTELRTGDTHPQPQTTERPSATPSTSQGEHLVPTPPKNCDVPWQPNAQTSAHKPIGITPDIRLDSMRIPKVEPTSGTGPECWQVVPDNPQVGTQNAQPENPPVNTDVNAQEA